MRNASLPSGILSSIRVNQTHSEANENTGVFDQERTIQSSGRIIKGEESRLGVQIDLGLTLAQQCDLGSPSPA